MSKQQKINISEEIETPNFSSNNLNSNELINAIVNKLQIETSIKEKKMHKRFLEKVTVLKRENIDKKRA